MVLFSSGLIFKGNFVLVLRWAYFRVGLLSVRFSFLKFGGPTIRWAYYPVGLLSGFYGNSPCFVTSFNLENTP